MSGAGFRKGEILVLLGSLSVGVLLYSGLAADSNTLALPADTSDSRRAPNILFVVFDTTRFDEWTCFNPDLETTPNLAKLAGRAVLFPNCYSLYTSTVPSHICMFTGHVPFPPKSPPKPPLNEARFRYENSSIFRILPEHGYKASGYSGNPILYKDTMPTVFQNIEWPDRRIRDRMPQEQLDQILRLYGEYVEDKRTLPAEKLRVHNIVSRYSRHSAQYVNEAVLEGVEQRLREEDGRPAFVFINYNDAHAPYFPEEPFNTLFQSEEASDFNGNLLDFERRREPTDLRGGRLAMWAVGLSKGDIVKARDLHRCELAFADHYFGELLERLGKLGFLDSALIICVSDHGELFGEYNRMGHGGKGFEELVHVPLFMIFPNDEFAGAVVEERVDHRDIKPTILDYLGIEDDTSRGRSLLPRIRGNASGQSAKEGTEPEEIPEMDGNLVGGQNPEADAALIESLKALGYVGN